MENQGTFDFSLALRSWFIDVPNQHVQEWLQDKGDSVEAYLSLAGNCTKSKLPIPPNMKCSGWTKNGQVWTQTCDMNDGSNVKLTSRVKTQNNQVAQMAHTSVAGSVTVTDDWSFASSGPDNKPAPPATFTPPKDCPDGAVPQKSVFMKRFM